MCMKEPRFDMTAFLFGVIAGIKMATNKIYKDYEGGK